VKSLEFGRGGLGVGAGPKGVKLGAFKGPTAGLDIPDCGRDAGGSAGT